MPVSINQIKSGLTLEFDGEVFIVQEYHHVKPGKGAAFVRIKLKNFTTGAVLERTFKSDDKLNEAFIEESRLIFQYNSGDTFHFMNQKNYEEVIIPKEKIERETKFLKDNLEISAFFFEGKLLKINLPSFIELKVAETEPGMKGDTVKAGTKTAKLETGLLIQVPLFINSGDRIKVDTRTGTYVERI